MVCLCFFIICPDTSGLVSLSDPATLGFDRYPPLVGQLTCAAAGVRNYSNCSVRRMQPSGEVVCPIYPPSQQVRRRIPEVKGLFFVRTLAAWKIHLQT